MRNLSLLYNNQYEKCLSILNNITILPHEGARHGRDSYRHACVLYAFERMKNGDFKSVLKLVEKAK